MCGAEMLNLRSTPRHTLEYLALHVKVTIQGTKGGVFNALASGRPNMMFMFCMA